MRKNDSNILVTSECEPPVAIYALFVQDKFKFNHCRDVCEINGESELKLELTNKIYLVVVVMKSLNERNEELIGKKIAAYYLVVSANLP